jgi:disulfide bond formation protein DsbB
MRLTNRNALLLLGLASLLALLTAYALQHLAGFAPCQLCYWQRYPYMAVIAVAVLGALTGLVRPALALAGVLFLVGAGIAFYHVGVEQGVFALPTGCASVGAATSIEDLRAQLATAAPACDQISVAFLGLSLSAWNGIAAATLTLASVAALLAIRPISR